MEPSKMLELQSQMRQNNAELLDFVKDLDSWETDIKKKEENLKSPDQNKNTSASNLPPVRGSFIKKKKKKKEKVLNKNNKENSKKISGFDFQAWDKYDVDAELELMDLDKSEESDSETDEEAEEQRKIFQANNLKDMGNQKFKEKNYDEAIDCYTRGMVIDPNNAVLPANRAMALLKQDKFAAAEVDCSLAISLDPSYVKAWLRRASARLKVNKTPGALTDYQHVLKLEPSNKQAKSEVERLEKILSPKKEDINTDSGIVKPIYKPENKRSKKPLRRIPIEEIGVPSSLQRQEQIAKQVASQSSAAQTIVSKENEGFEHFVKGTVKTHEDHTIHTLSNKEAEQIINKNDLSVLNQGTCKHVPSGQTVEDLCGVAHIPDTPTSSFQFQIDWKSLKSHPDQFYEYFKQIDPSQYCKLFGQALELDMFLQIMNTLHNFYIPYGADIYPVLHHFADVKRFSMTVMFMSSKDKEVVEKLFQHMRTSGIHNAEEIDNLAHRYTL